MHSPQAPSHHQCPSPTHVCTWMTLQNDGTTHTDDVSDPLSALTPPLPHARACTCPIEGILRSTLGVYSALVSAGWGREHPGGGYSMSCLSSPWLNRIVQSWQSRSRLLSFNNLCCLTKPAKSRITSKYSNGTQLRRQRLASNPIPAGVYFSN